MNLFQALETVLDLARIGADDADDVWGNDHEEAISAVQALARRYAPPTDNAQMVESKLVCRQCASTGRFLHLAEITATRRVIGFREDGKLQVESRLTADSEEAAENERLVCQHCLTELAIPSGMEVEYT